jgi:hypothetical protein
MSFMSRLLPITALILAGALTVARADVYRWIDDHGVPHYSDEWVPGSVVVKTVKPHPSSFTSTAHTAEHRSLASSSDRASTELNDQANARAVQQDVTKTREVQCKAAKDRYMKSVQSRRVFKVNKDGAREYLSDDAADAYRAEARKEVLDLCGSVPAFNPDQPVPEPQPIPEPKVNPAEATSP